MTTLQQPPARAGSPPEPADEQRGRPSSRGWLVATVYLVTALMAAGTAAVLAPSVAMLPFAVLLLWPLLLDSIRRPTFRRLAFRNVSRRKGEAALVILGSLLGTAIITASFVVGDTIDHSLRDLARTRLGPIDESVAVDGLGPFPAIADAVETADLAGTDGTLRHVSAGAAVASVTDDPLAEPDAVLTEIDFDAARQFGSGAGNTGLDDAGSTPAPGEAVINERLARKLEVDVGDRIVASAYGSDLELTVREILPEIGLAGFGSVDTLGFGPSQATPVFVSPGTIEDLAASSTVATAAPPKGQVLVSNEGGVFVGAEVTDQVTANLEDATATFDAVDVTTPKQDMLDDAEESGKSIQDLYFGIGTFSVIAGILLLVNLFVMLSEERKTELGMLRAVGFKRGHLTRSFAMEGATYAVSAAALGAVVGVGVAWVMTRIASGILAADDPDLVFRLHVQPATLIAGGAFGLSIALVTVWGTSFRISRLNIIAAIRDLPDRRHHDGGRAGLAFGAAGMAVGALVLFSGLSSDGAVATMAGFPIMAFSAIPLLRRFVSLKPAIIGASVAVLAWGLSAFTLFPDAMEGSDIGVFVVMGIALVGATVAISSQIDHLWLGLTERLPSRSGNLATRLGLAYPLARKFRTGMLLGMYAIVIFTMTFMSVFIGIFVSQAPTFVNELSAGYDLYVDSNRGNPISVEKLESQPEVAAVAPLDNGVATFKVADGVGDNEGQWPVTGFDQSLLDRQAPILGSRAPEYATDQEAFRAVLDDDSLVIIDDFFLQNGGGPQERKADVGDEITMVNPATGEEKTLTVVGVHSSDFIFNGSYVGRPFLEQFLGPQAVESRHYVAVTDGADPDRVADQLGGRFLANGVDASSFKAEVDKELQQNEAFFSLLRGYLALGLVIGIAGLGVVMVRAVRERRREIGMLRAMGVQPRTVRRAFLFEATFVALQGAIFGIALGVLTSWEVVVNSSTFGDQTLSFSIPLLGLGLILLGPLVASLLAVAAPATQASRIAPAAALRIAD